MNTNTIEALIRRIDQLENKITELEVSEANRFATALLKDGITAPSTVASWGQLYIDTSDGLLKIKYGDGTVETIGEVSGAIQVDSVEAGAASGTPGTGDVFAADDVQADGELRASYANIGSPSSPASAAGDLVAADDIDAEGSLISGADLQVGTYAEIGNPSSPLTGTGDLTVADDLKVDGNVYTLDYADISGSCSYSGWSSRSETRVYRMVVGDMVHIWFRVVGTSNSNTCSFTLPYDGSSATWIFTCLTTNNGTQDIGYCGKASGAGTITFIRNATAGTSGWTSSGTKAVYGYIAFRRS